MATIDCATIVKRGYLSDKSGILERKRWFVLRQDYGQGYCILENYKNEKSALKGESPVGFINIYQVVDVRRVLDKKQSFELLCPGIAHRLMANSESDADEWVEYIQRLSIYKRDDSRSLSLQRAVPIIGGRPRSGSVSGSPPIVTTFNPNINTMNGMNQSMAQLQQTYPTPPESVVTLAPHPPPPPMLQKQSSLEATPSHPYPSPPSSDSSSMCSGSNTSFDNGGENGDIDMTRLKLRVHVKENDRLSVSGPCDVIVNEEGISLYSIQSGYPFGVWPITSIRRYGVNNSCFTFETGKNCFTGEGRFFFLSPQSRLMHGRVHYLAQKKELRRASAPDTLTHTTRAPTHSHMTPSHSHMTSSQQALMQQHAMMTSSMSLQGPHPPHMTTIHHQMSSPSSLNMMSSSPPQYNHVEHNLRPNFSIEPYGRINHSNTPLSPPFVPITSGLTHMDYEKLNHTPNCTPNLTPSHIPSTSRDHTPNTSFTNVLLPPVTEQCNYVTVQHTREEEEEEELSPIYSNVQLARNGEEEPEDVPPPLPPRTARMESV